LPLLSADHAKELGLKNSRREFLSGESSKDSLHRKGGIVEGDVILKSGRRCKDGLLLLKT
jgi:hypothetical protein